MNVEIDLTEIENAWRQFDMSREMLSEDQQLVWRMLKCRYRMLRLSKNITVEQIKEFKRQVADFERLAMGVQYA